jgi:hypothetical protein
MVNIYLIKITNPQGGSASNIGGQINMCFTNFNKINILAESHGDWSVTPTIGAIADTDFQDARCAPGMLGVL